jgi:hypothetical protein
MWRSENFKIVLLEISILLETSSSVQDRKLLLAAVLQYAFFQQAFTLHSTCSHFTEKCKRVTFLDWKNVWRMTDKNTVIKSGCYENE